MHDWRYDGVATTQALDSLHRTFSSLGYGNRALFGLHLARKAVVRGMGHWFETGDDSRVIAAIEAAGKQIDRLGTTLLEGRDVLLC